MVKDNIIKDKAFNFALSIVKLNKILIDNKEFVLSKQLLKSGTSIGANVEEASAGISKRDFIAKMSIASKEARETHYWLRLLSECQIANQDYSKYLKDCTEIINILTAIVKTSQKNIQN